MFEIKLIFLLTFKRTNTALSKVDKKELGL